MALRVDGLYGSGIEDAAIAMVFSRILALVLGLGIVFRGNRGIQIRLQQMTPDLSFDIKDLQK